MNRLAAGCMSVGMLYSRFVCKIWNRVINRFRVVFEDREILCQQYEEQDVAGNDADCHQ